jgi:hypothetical protein
MNENRRQILEMLPTGKITADEAERLIDALETETLPPAGEHSGSNSDTAKTRAKYLRVLVEADEPDDSMSGMKGQITVNVRVPMQLLRDGVRLASFIPVQAHHQLDEALNKYGVPLTLSEIRPENLDELIDHLEDLTVNVNSSEGNSTKVRVFCE